jgi:hypothetical protein
MSGERVENRLVSPIENHKAFLSLLSAWPKGAMKAVFRGRRLRCSLPLSGTHRSPDHRQLAGGALKRTLQLDLVAAH